MSSIEVWIGLMVGWALFTNVCLVVLGRKILYLIAPDRKPKILQAVPKFHMIL
jgi:hypothetical protein